MTPAEWVLSKNQGLGRTNELDAQGETRLYRALRHFWHPVLYSAELGDEPRPVVLCDQRLVVVRLDGEVRVFDDLCAHRGTALSLGWVVVGSGGQELRCPYHGWQYDGEGRCTLTPTCFGPVESLDAHVRRYPAVERYGMVWTSLTDDPVLPLPTFAQYDDPSYDTVRLEPSEWACSAARRLENFVDLGHFAILHDGYLGLVDHPEVPRHEVWREGSILRIRQLEPNREPVNLKFESEALAEDFTWTQQEWWIHMPLTVLLHQELPGDRHYLMFFHATPVSQHITRNFTLSARNYGEAERMEEEVLAFTRVIYAQDKPVVEAQRPHELQEDLSYELHLKGVDSVAISYRRWLLELTDRVCAN